MPSQKKHPTSASTGKYKMTGVKTEPPITFERLDITMRFQLLLAQLSTRPDLDMTLSTLATFPDVNLIPNSKWPPRKPEVKITIDRNELATRFPTANLHLRSNRTRLLILPTLPDVWLITEFKIVSRVFVVKSSQVNLIFKVAYVARATARSTV